MSIIKLLLQTIDLRTNLILRKVYTMSQQYDLIKAKLNELQTTVDSVIVKLQDLKDKVTNATTLEEVQALINDIELERTRLQDTLNTIG